MALEKLAALIGSVAGLISAIVQAKLLNPHSLPLHALFRGVNHYKNPVTVKIYLIPFL